MEDIRNLAIDALIRAVLTMHAPDMVADYDAGSLPLWFECRLERASTAAHRLTERSGSDDDSGYLVAYAQPIGPLVSMVMRSRLTAGSA